ncbi:MAG: hypothetical protein HKO93_08045 [Flavobacteriales bacterium]|nr:hypothetical protein [Flavobacteriales bacterium]
MIKFFRRIRQRLLSESKFSKYLIYAIGEIILVVIGILIALQINTWNEERKDSQTASILAESLIADLNKDRDFIKNAIQLGEQKIVACDRLIHYVKIFEDLEDLTELYGSLNIVSQSHPFFPTDGTYQQVVTSGTLMLFDQELANQLNGYSMQLKKCEYWANVEDEALWKLADLVFADINLQVLMDLRLQLDEKNEMFFNLSAQDRPEFINLVAYVQTVRTLTLNEYREQLKVAEKLINELSDSYINSDTDR